MRLSPLLNGLHTSTEASRCAHLPFSRSITTEATPTLLSNSESLQHNAPTTSITQDSKTSDTSPISTFAKSQSRQPYQPIQNPFLTTAPCSIHRFPSLEPAAIVQYPGSHLLLPLRRDILHRAVVYEADMARQGTASTKWRREVHGSTRKIRPQKGTGSARLGDKKSPMLRGGGVAHGPKPRDFSTKLPQKVYDLAFRTALSHRYRSGELLVTREKLQFEGVDKGSMERYVQDFLKWNALGSCLFVTYSMRTDLFDAIDNEKLPLKARALEKDLVDVKDLLHGSKVVIEKAALDAILQEHESDLAPETRLNRWLLE